MPQIFVLELDGESEGREDEGTVAVTAFREWGRVALAPLEAPLRERRETETKTETETQTETERLAR